MSTKKTRGRNWSDGETDIFAKILVDPVNDFAQALDTLSMKRSSNKQTFVMIKKCFDNELKKNGYDVKERDLDRSVENLRVKYRNLKQEWKRMHDKIKDSAGFDGAFEIPNWYATINPVFSDSSMATSSEKDSSFLPERSYEDFVADIQMKQCYSDDETQETVYLVSEYKDADKMRSKTSRGRNWSDEETNLFAEVLVDPVNNFARALETLAAKRSSNKFTFVTIKKFFDKELEKVKDDFSKNNGALDTRIEKLRFKYRNMKQEWRKIHDTIKKGTKLVGKSKPQWYSIIDPVFKEANVALEAISPAEDTARIVNCSNEDIEDENETEPVCHKDETHLPGPYSSDSESVNRQRPDVYYDTRVNLNKKRKTVSPQELLITEVTSSFRMVAEMQEKRQKETLEYEKRRDELFIKHLEEEGKRNREHELRIAEIFAQALAGLRPQQVAPVCHINGPTNNMVAISPDKGNSENFLRTPSCSCSKSSQSNEQLTKSPEISSTVAAPSRQNRELSRTVSSDKSQQ